ncbi:MAG: hypothetical protein KA362_20635, partial [Chloroflexi bacterium]|nr:hypothetical protein [Chloroflexota bacterium]
QNLSQIDGTYFYLSSFKNGTQINADQNLRHLLHRRNLRIFIRGGLATYEVSLMFFAVTGNGQGSNGPEQCGMKLQGQKFVSRFNNLLFKV